MARVFREFGFDNVVLLRGREATRDAILSTLNEVKGSLSADDLFVFYFAGHGMTVRGGGSKLTGYLLPVNCRSRHEARDGISMASLKDLADTMPSRHSLFLMDACYSGFGLSEGVSRSAAGAAGDGSPSSCVQILTAGGELDRAFEVDGHGLFTGFILNSLEDIARKGKGGISCRQLASVVKKQVAEQTGGWQTPQFGFAGDGDIRLVKLQAKPGEAVAMAN